MTTAFSWDTSDNDNQLGLRGEKKIRNYLVNLFNFSDKNKKQQQQRRRRKKKSFVIVIFYFCLLLLLFPDIDYQITCRIPTVIRASNIFHFFLTCMVTVICAYQQWYNVYYLLHQLYKLLLLLLYRQFYPVITWTNGYQNLLHQFDGNLFTVSKPAS